MLSSLQKIDIAVVSERDGTVLSEHNHKGMSLVSLKTNSGEVIWVVLKGDDIVFAGSKYDYRQSIAKDGTNNRWFSPRA